MQILVLTLNVQEHTHTPLNDVVAIPARVLLNLHLTFAEHLGQLWEEPLVPLDRALKLSDGEGQRERGAELTFSLREIDVLYPLVVPNDNCHPRRS